MIAPGTLDLRKKYHASQTSQAMRKAIIAEIEAGQGAIANLDARMRLVRAGRLSYNHPTVRAARAWVRDLESQVREKYGMPPLKPGDGGCLWTPFAGAKKVNSNGNGQQKKLSAQAIASIVDTYAAGGVGVSSLARQFGVSPPAIAYHLARHGIHAVRRKYTSEQDRKIAETVRMLAEEMGRSDSEIARRAMALVKKPLKGKTDGKTL